MFSFGAWLKYPEPRPDGPNMAWVCSLFNTTQPFEVIWMSPPPKKRQDNTVANYLPQDRPYNVQACN